MNQPADLAVNNAEMKPRLKGRILVVGDSQVRGFGSLMKQCGIFSKYSVSVSCDPGAGLSSVINSVIALIDEFSFSDHVFILGGTNDGENLHRLDFSILNRQSWEQMFIFL